MRFQMAMNDDLTRWLTPRAPLLPAEDPTASAGHSPTAGLGSSPQSTADSPPSELPSTPGQKKVDLGDGELLIRPGSKGASIPSRMWVHYVGDPDEREEEQLDPFAICVQEMEVFLKAAGSAFSDLGPHASPTDDSQSAAEEGHTSSTDDETDDDGNSRPSSPPARYPTPFAPDAVIAGKRALKADMRLPNEMLSAIPTAGGGEDDQSRPTERVAQSPRPAEDVGAGAEEGRSTEDEGEGGERQGQGSQEDGAVLMVEAECLPGEPGKEARGEQKAKEPSSSASPDDSTPKASTAAVGRRPPLRRAHSSPLMDSPVTEPVRFRSAAAVTTTTTHQTAPGRGPSLPTSPRRSPAAEYAATLRSSSRMPPDLAHQLQHQHAHDRLSPMRSPASSCGSPGGVVSTDQGQADWREPRGRGSYFPDDVS